MRVLANISLLCSLLIASPAMEPDGTSSSPDELMRQVVRIESDAMSNQQPRWMYFLTDDKENISITRMVLETHQGTISKTVCRNRQALSNPETQAERQHLDQLVSNPGEQQKHFRREARDEARIEELIRMLAGGFRFESLGPVGNLIRLKFYPNAAFHPGNIDQRIFHAMTGTVLVDPRRKRLVRIAGYFLRDVDFGAGLLGKIKQGGTVDIVRQDVGQGDWNPVELHVGVKARVLFKSLDLRRNLRFWGFRPVRSGMSLKEAVAVLKQQPSTCPG